MALDSDHPTTDPESDDDGRSLPDVTALPIDAILASGDSAITRALRRIAAAPDLGGPEVAAFGNFAPADPLPT
jgi:FXSXX-COOH protein